MTSFGKAAYLLFFFLTIVIATILRSFSDGIGKHFSAFGACNKNDHCFGNQAVYRVSCCTTAFFTIMMVLTFASEQEFHSGCWCLKAPAFIFSLLASLFISNGFFDSYVEVARFFAAVFIVLQIIILIDFSYEVHEFFSRKIEALEHESQAREALLSNNSDSTSGSPNTWKALYLGVGFSCVVCSLIGIVLMYKTYGGCTIGIVFVTITVASCIILTGLSVSNLTNIGLMTPALINAYSVYLCWQALSSHPDKMCNPSATYNDTNNSEAVSVFLAAFAITWTSWRMSASTKSLFTLGEANLSTDDSDEEGEKRLNGLLTGDDQDTNTPKASPVSSDSPCWQFHLIMLLGSLYMAMALTAWGAADGSTPSHSRTSSLTSVWVKIGSQWITSLLYLWTIIAPNVLTNRDFE